MWPTLSPCYQNCPRFLHRRSTQIFLFFGSKSRYLTLFQFDFLFLRCMTPAGVSSSRFGHGSFIWGIAAAGFVHFLFSIYFRMSLALVFPQVPTSRAKTRKLRVTTTTRMTTNSVRLRARLELNLQSHGLQEFPEVTTRRKMTLVPRMLRRPCF